MPSYLYVCVLIPLHSCPHTPIHVSSYLCMCPHTPIHVLPCIHLSTYSAPPHLLRSRICFMREILVLPSLRMCPHTAVHMPSYLCVCVLIPLHTYCAPAYLGLALARSLRASSLACSSFVRSCLQYRGRMCSRMRTHIQYEDTKRSMRTLTRMRTHIVE